MIAKLTKTKAQAIGWRVLAGSFHPGDKHDEQLAQSILDHITKTGGRAALVDAENGLIEIWRPSGEMETHEQTEDRLRRLSLRVASSEYEVASIPSHGKAVNF